MLKEGGCLQSAKVRRGDKSELWLRVACLGQESGRFLADLRGLLAAIGGQLWVKRVENCVAGRSRLHLV